ncbi:MAG: DUF393 domain-containing protein [Pseudomonadota bacterium]
MPGHPEKALTVYYDGTCPLCRAEIDHYASRPGAERIRFADASDLDADLGGGLDRQTALGRFHVRLEDGRLVSGAAGFVAIWSILPGWRWLARLAGLPGALPMLEWLYRRFLPVRPTIARLLCPLLRLRTHGAKG